jgi:hypothetical protein
MLHLVGNISKGMTLCLHFLQSCAYKFLTVKRHIFSVNTDYLGDYID